jgi:hypothetical protein
VNMNVLCNCMIYPLSFIAISSVIIVSQISMWGVRLLQSKFDRKIEFHSLLSRLNSELILKSVLCIVRSSLLVIGSERWHMLMSCAGWLIRALMPCAGWLISLRGQVLALQRSDLCQDFMVTLNLLTSRFTEEKDGLFINFAVLGTFRAITDSKRSLESRTCESSARIFSYDRGLTLFRKVKDYNSCCTMEKCLALGSKDLNKLYINQFLRIENCYLFRFVELFVPVTKTLLNGFTSPVSVLLHEH